ncbi:MarR family transcriptional regulator [Salipiger sp. P9]|uniref:MarR family winged helix-turn-helix transcriptional regulator n=1 Tax=Salipiger pentaromativorans TaxID=2943193 RepID=UPI0021582D0E|nr:MarR family transcriptional regulator [Salipiger pentaromativorans]MCR8548682.1 MarR family transcriptional regulator [Salipiger pentaromativorans]
MCDKPDRYGVVRRVGEALLRFMQQIEAVYEHSAQSSEIHSTDFRAICLMGEHNAPMSPTEIGHALGLTSGAVSALLLRLEAAGLISREPNPKDRRGVLISLDERAAAQALRDYTELRVHYTQITDEFSAEELEVVARYLENIRRVTTEHLAFSEADRATRPQAWSKDRPVSPQKDRRHAGRRGIRTRPDMGM